MWELKTYLPLLTHSLFVQCSEKSYVCSFRKSVVRVYACTHCMQVPTVCMYPLYACTHCMHVPTVCMYPLYACTHCMQVPTVCMYPLYACTHCMHVPTVGLLAPICGSDTTQDLYIMWNFCSECAVDRNAGVQTS